MKPIALHWSDRAGVIHQIVSLQTVSILSQAFTGFTLRRGLSLRDDRTMPDRTVQVLCIVGGIYSVRKMVRGIDTCRQKAEEDDDIARY
jgi:hypothetical protein